MPTQRDREDKGISDREMFDRLVSKQSEMPRRHCAVHNREEFKYEALEHELHASAPPTAPSDAAMRAAEEICAYFGDTDLAMGGHVNANGVAAIITRHLAAAPAAREQENQ